MNIRSTTIVGITVTEGDGSNVAVQSNKTSETENLF